MNARPLAAMLFALALPALLGSCTAGAPAPQSAPSPTASPRPAPSPPPAQPAPPAPDNWIDAPQTPGSWRYGADGRRTVARFGTGGGEEDFTLSCEPAARTITLIRKGAATPPAYIRILTETQTRLLDAETPPVTPAVVTTSLDAGDPLFDAMALSRGRFAVETSGLATLYLPSWAEVTRVVEDCR
jgi:hypothetical protein